MVHADGDTLAKLAEYALVREGLIFEVRSGTAPIAGLFFFWTETIEDNGEFFFY